ncbi:hypothetical protein C241_01219 [Bradyrhizobium lupini HPC(L)]|uniref:Uncharacterized protein n=2 Tax=Rhizobium lupini TaxID=136996 RepID=A0ABP2RWG7_RHILU|nr:hypothetical protein C241_01219 [Bradyrhizobium lupini HPC(L)]
MVDAFDNQEGRKMGNDRQNHPRLESPMGKEDEAYDLHRFRNREGNGETEQNGKARQLRYPAFQPLDDFQVRQGPDDRPVERTENAVENHGENDDRPERKDENRPDFAVHLCQPPKKV